MAKGSGYAVVWGSIGGGRFQAAVAALAALLVTAALAAPAPERPSEPSGATKTGALAAYGKLPLSFIPNRGQTDESVRYYAQGAGFGFYFTDSKAVLSFQDKERGQALQLRFLGASANATLESERQRQGEVNFVRGDDPRKWQTGLPTYGQLAYQGLWPGIDMRFRGAGGTLKYEFHLARGADPERIRLAYAGAEALSLGSSGSLLIRTPLGTLRDARPHAWQQIGGRKVPVQSRYSLNPRAGAAHAYGFELGAYDHSRPVVIDPGIAYSTFLGGTGTDLGNDIAVDGAGSAYVTGRTTSSGFPATAGSFDPTHNGAEDAFVTKLDASGSALAYSTFLGGTGVEEATGLAVDGAGSAYVTGETTSSDFPTTAGAFDTTSNGGDAFITKLAASGDALSYSSYLGGTGGTDIANAVTVDDAGSAYVTGYTSSFSFPTTAGAFDTTYTAGGSFDAFVTKVDASGSTLAYSTYLGGGGGTDSGNAVEVDAAGSAYVAGGTRSASFPTTAGAFDTSHNGDDDAFVTKLNASGSALVFSTYVGATGADGAAAVALDAPGNVYLTGFTNSSGYPTTAGAFDTSYNDDGDAFVTKLNASGAALAYSTFLGGTGTGGTGYDSGSGIAVDGAGGAYVTGRTDSLLFPTTTGAFDTSYNGVGDAFVAKVNAAGSGLAYSTYLGDTGTDQGSGIGLDGTGAAYVTGYTTSSGFPTTAGAFDTTSNGSYDVFVTKLDLAQAGYPRPIGAAKVRVTLLPAFRECIVPNSTHGEPLDRDSCTSAVQESDNVTVPNDDSSTARASAVLAVRCFDPVTGASTAETPPCADTPGENENVFVSASGTDVRCAATASPLTSCGTANATPGADYTGELLLEIPLRITDRDNGLGADGTVSDARLRVAMSCTGTDPTTGGACNVATSVNAVVPGAVKENKRAIWEIGQVQVLDAGDNGSIVSVPSPICPPTCEGGDGDEAVFLRQGIAVP